MVLAEFEDVEEAAAPIMADVGFMPAETAPDDLSIKRMRLFAGYSGWGAGQLEAELEEPSWIVVDAEPDQFSVSLIPTTLELTTLGRKVVGDPVNLEVDVIAKYVERMIGATS